MTVDDQGCIIMEEVDIFVEYAGPAFYTTASQVTTMEFVSFVQTFNITHKNFIDLAGPGNSENSCASGICVEFYCSKPGGLGIHHHGGSNRITTWGRMG